MLPGCSFRLRHADAATGARRATLTTPRGDVETPAFMPVGTVGTVKGLCIDQLCTAGAQILLANTYHLTLRPGAEVVEELGGLHRFMAWDGPILTDSGGFQIFSLAQQAEITEEQATFRSHVDGRVIELSPERAVDIQQQLGSDIAMVLDHAVALPNERAVVEDAMHRTVRWARRCREHATRTDQALFAIVQGGLEADLRIACAEELRQIDFPGYAIGGLSVGETPAQMYATIEATLPALPDDRPRYLMGVGRPQDLLEAVARGVDLFDCVIPTRNGRNALAYTGEGPRRLRNQRYQRDPKPLDEDCPCPACRHSRGYLRHLFLSREMLGPVLLSLHNLTFYHRLLAGARRAIEEDRFDAYRRQKLQNWETSTEDGGEEPDGGTPDVESAGPRK